MASERCTTCYLHVLRLADQPVFLLIPSLHDLEVDDVALLVAVVVGQLPSSILFSLLPIEELVQVLVGLVDLLWLEYSMPDEIIRPIRLVLVPPSYCPKNVVVHRLDFSPVVQLIHWNSLFLGWDTAAPPAILASLCDGR